MDNLITATQSLIPSGIMPPGSAIAGTGGGPAAGSVDETPDPEKLKAEIARLQDQAKYWREEKRKSRAEFFQERPRLEEITRPARAAEESGLGAEPKQADFDDYEKYIDAKMTYTTRRARAEWDRDQERKRRETDQLEKISALQTKIREEGFKSHDDFEEVALDPSVPITPLVVELLAESEIPHEVAYYLGKNRTEAIALSRMTPVQAARAIARIEMAISGNARAIPSTPKLPSAPAPINPVGSSHAVSKDPDKMSQKEYEAWRESQGARRF